MKQRDLLAHTLFTILFAVVQLIAFAENDVDIYISYRTSGNLFNIRRFLAASETLISLICNLLNAPDWFPVACDEFRLMINLKKIFIYQPAPEKPPSIYDNDKKS